MFTMPQRQLFSSSWFGIGIPVLFSALVIIPLLINRSRRQCIFARVMDMMGIGAALVQQDDPDRQVRIPEILLEDFDKDMAHIDVCWEAMNSNECATVWPEILDKCDWGITFIHNAYQAKQAMKEHGFSSDAAAQAQMCFTLKVLLARKTLNFHPENLVLGPRPRMATTTLPTLAILARRLGLIWQRFEPETGVLLAEGNNQHLTSIPTSSLGSLTVQYSISSTPNFSPAENPHLIIPTPLATSFLFGTIPAFPQLALPAFSIGSISAVHATANMLDPSGGTSQKIKDVRAVIEPHCTLGFSDLIPLASPMLRAHGSPITRVPSPSQYTGGLFRHEAGFKIFRHKLSEYIAEREPRGSVSDRTKWVLAQYDTLHAAFPNLWETEVQPFDSINSASRLPFLEKCHDVWDECTAYFVHLNAGRTLATLSAPGFTYVDLIAAHLKHAVGYCGDAWTNVKAGKARDSLGCHDWIAEGAHLYWDYLPRVVASLREKSSAPYQHQEGKKLRRNLLNEDLVREAWMVMVLRAFCWWRCHWTDQGWVGEEESRVEPRWRGSKARVFVF